MTLGIMSPMHNTGQYKTLGIMSPIHNTGQYDAGNNGIARGVSPVPHQVWPLRSECCGRGVPTKVVCAECMKMCCLGGKNSVVKGLRGIYCQLHIIVSQNYISR